MGESIMFTGYLTKIDFYEPVVLALLVYLCLC